MDSEPTHMHVSNVAVKKESLPGGQHGGLRGTGWFRLLAPSVTDLFFIAILFSLACGPFGMRLLGDAGIGWHIRNGEQILRTHAVPHTDSFSITMTGHAWYAWEWLYDLLIALIHGWLGLNGVVFFTALIIAVTFAVSLHVGLQRGGTVPITLLLLVLSIAAASVHFLARPHVLSWLFAVLWFHLLDSDLVMSRERKARGLFWYPLIMVLWVNLHGGFLLGFILFAIYVAGTLIRFFSREEEERKLIAGRLKYVGSAALLSFMASLVNPYGYKLYTHIYEYLGNRFLMDHIDEFLSPNFHGGAQECFAALLLIALIALAATHEKLHPARLLVIVFAAYSGLYSSRNLPLSSILLTLIIVPILSTTIASAAENSRIVPPLRLIFARLTSFSNRITTKESAFRGHLWAILAFIFGIAVCLHGGRVGNQSWINAHFSPKRFPVEATNIIVKNIIVRRGIHDPIFCPDYWGGYLIYRLYPQSKVFIDDRHDLYGEQFLEQYLQVIHVGPDWSKVLDRWQVNWVLSPTRSSLTNILKESPQWTPQYADQTATLFERVQ